METVFFVGAAILMSTPLYGSSSDRHRDRVAQQAGERIVRDRYIGTTKPNSML
jgi:hypothetical protein